MSKEISINIDTDKIAEYVMSQLEDEVIRKVQEVLDKEHYGYRDNSLIYGYAKSACIDEAKNTVEEHEDEIIQAVIDKVSTSIINRKKLKVAMELLDKMNDEVQKL